MKKLSAFDYYFNPSPGERKREIYSRKNPLRNSPVTLDVQEELL